MMFGSSVDRAEPVCIIEQVQEDRSFVLDGTRLRDLLHNSRIRDKKICIISVAGAFRKGKSFLLDFFIRYLKKISHDSYNVHDHGDWLGGEDEGLTGFKWRGGSERETTGIWAWSEIFLCERTVISDEFTDTDGFVMSSSEEIAVLLMDTQGTFDSESSMKECVTIFALGAMLSSTLIFNLSQNIQEDDLQHLQFFTEYGKLAMEETDDKPFQTLLFLVRDWPNPDEHGYGLNGGKAFLKKKLENAGKHKDLEDVRKGIRECFSHLECFLMPYPGNKVATNRNCSGKLAEMDDEFKEHMKAFVPHVASAINLKVKTIGGQEVRCGELLDYMTSYVEAFQGERLPSASTLVQTTAEAHHLAALEQIKCFFMSQLNEECGADKPYLPPDGLEKKLESIRDAAIKEFDKHPKIGGSAMRATYLEKLDGYIIEMSTEYTKGNDNKANVLVWVASGIAYIIWPITSSKVFTKVHSWFIHRAMDITSALGHPLDALGRLGNQTWSLIDNYVMPKLPEHNPISKGISAALAFFHTPIVLLMIMIIANIFSYIFAMSGIASLAAYSSFVILGAFTLLCVWLFSFFTGKAVLMRRGIERATNVIWDLFTADPAPEALPPGPASAETTSTQGTVAPRGTGQADEDGARGTRRRRTNYDSSSD